MNQYDSGSTAANPVIVGNMSGAGTLIGAEAVARVAPDGLTLLVYGLLNQREGSRLQHIPYPGLAPMLTALAAGKVQLATAEQGFGYLQASIWYGVFAPAGTPAGVIDQVGADIADILRTPIFAERRTTARGLTVVAATAAAFRSQIARDVVSIGEMVRAVVIQPQ